MAREERNYPLNCWWVAARSEEIGRAPLQRWLLDTPVVMYRDLAGAPVALDDRCPHRWAPLSGGKVDGNNIVCPYHGAQFSPTGACPLFPLQEVIPRSMRVQSFPVVERGPFIWIWMGDIEAKNSAQLPPDFSWNQEPGWTIATGNYDFDGNYMLLHENVLDLTHFNHVHNKSFQFENWKPAPEFRSVENRVQSLTTLAADNFNDIERAVVGLSDPDASHVESDSWFETPAWHYNLSRVHSRSDPQRILSTNHISHLVTPASPTSTHYWWYVGSDVPMSLEQGAGFGGLIERAFLEDKEIMEAIQKLITRDPRGRAYPELSFKNDGSGILARRALDRILAQEPARS